jgi:hypothetical protein
MVGETEFWIERDAKIITEARPVKVGKFEELIKEMSFDLISNTIKAICVSLTSTFTQIPKKQRPTKFSTSFGLKISGDLKLVVVNAGAGADWTINAEWQLTDL